MAKTLNSKIFYEAFRGNLDFQHFSYEITDVFGSFLKSELVKHEDNLGHAKTYPEFELKVPKQRNLPFSL